MQKICIAYYGSSENREMPHSLDWSESSKLRVRTVSVCMCVIDSGCRGKNKEGDLVVV